MGEAAHHSNLRRQGSQDPDQWLLFIRVKTWVLLSHLHRCVQERIQLSQEQLTALIKVRRTLLAHIGALLAEREQIGTRIRVSDHPGWKAGPPPVTVQSIVRVRTDLDQATLGACCRRAQTILLSHDMPA